ncbi:ABC transporter permease [Bosea minatitlanensis]|uniref:Transport permease protein n=1 Tax=Bosea minatitlanensis TaxID=128782 RepID=A0ABW0FA79_9HYPH|nr:ABC transporter permease [Bosea minatitlanensis]MCT4493013.1 ABC transporter permease [Bosea minatitlanensis]
MIALPAPFDSFARNRYLIAELVKRELKDRHVGQTLGVLWAYGHPLLLMLIYTFLFAYVFPTRFASTGGDQRDFAVNVLAGVLSWLAFQDILARSSTILASHTSLVKQIVFPVEVLPVKSAIATALPYSVALVFTIAYAAWSGTLTLMVLTAPFLIVVQLLAMTGIALLLSVLGIFFRDLRDVVTVFCSVNLFAQPILYNPEALPPIMHRVFMLNPFSYQVWCWQDALYHGSFQHPAAWIIYPISALLTFAIGWATFSRLRPFLGDAL